MLSVLAQIPFRKPLKRKTAIEGESPAIERPAWIGGLECPGRSPLKRVQVSRPKIRAKMRQNWKVMWVRVAFTQGRLGGGIDFVGEKQLDNRCRSRPFLIRPFWRLKSS